MDIQNFKVPLLSLFLVLSACATTKVNNDYKLDNHQSEGIVIVSILHDKKEGTSGAKGVFYVDNNLDKGRDVKLTSTKQKQPGGWDLRSEFEDAYGRLYVFSLPKGQHKLTGWKILNGTGYFSSSEDKTKPLVFNVKGGEIKYLGNWHIKFRIGENFLGVKIVESGYPEIKNESQRDIALFEKQYPKFKGKATIQPLVLGPWVTLEAVIMKQN